MFVLHFPLWIVMPVVFVPVSLWILVLFCVGIGKKMTYKNVAAVMKKGKMFIGNKMS